MHVSFVLGQAVEYVLDACSKLEKEENHNWKIRTDTHKKDFRPLDLKRTSV